MALGRITTLPSNAAPSNARHFFMGGFVQQGGGLTAKSGESTWRGPSYDSRARNAGNPVGMVAGALCICCRFDGNASPDFANAHPGQGEALRVGAGFETRPTVTRMGV